MLEPDPPLNMPDSRLTVRVPSDLHARAAALADADDRSLSSVVRKALTVYLDTVTAAPMGRAA